MNSVSSLIRTPRSMSNHCCFYLLGVFLFLGGLSDRGKSAPVVLNPSFESIGPLIWPGMGIISNWTAIGFAGVNPFYPEATGGNELSFQYANNGLIPHGTNVAYLASNFERDVDTSLTQTITGFEGGKTYVVRFFHNGAVRHGSFAGIFMNLTLGPSTLINFEYMNLGDGAHVAWGVEDYLQFTKPYRRRLSAEWTAPSSGSFDLVFSMESNYRTDFPAGTPYEERKLLGNSAWLIDTVSIVELGNLELTRVRRNFTNTTQLVATFNKATLAERATNIKNYRLDGALAITRAEMISTNEVLLNTSAESTGDSRLRVEDLIDLEGRGMFRSKSEKTVDISPRLPLDFSRSTTGFEDDFNSALRDPRWIFSGEGTDAFRPFYGVLKVGNMTGRNNFLLWNDPDVDPVIQEVLIRLRFSALAPDIAGGGAAVAVSKVSHEGVRALASSKGLILDGKNLPEGPSNTNSVELNRWYWMRLKHQSHTEASGNEVAAKMWLADGETMEPSDLAWNYAPPSALRQGLAGIAAGQEASSIFEVDYILIKSPDGPPLEPQIPAEFPVALTIQRNNQEILLQWRTNEGFHLYYREEFAETPWQFVEDVVSEDVETGLSTYVVPLGTSPRFYQLER